MTTQVKVLRIERSRGLRLKRGIDGRVLRRNSAGEESADFEGDEVCEEAEVRTVVLGPIPHRGPSDSLFFATTDPAIAAAFDEGAEYSVAFHKTKDAPQKQEAEAAPK